MEIRAQILGLITGSPKQWRNNKNKAGNILVLLTTMVYIAHTAYSTIKTGIKLVRYDKQTSPGAPGRANKRLMDKSSSILITLYTILVSWADPQILKGDSPPPGTPAFIQSL